MQRDLPIKCLEPLRIGCRFPSQVHLLKLFDNVKSLSFGRGNRQVVGMGSSEGETFLMREPVAVEGPVEVWMAAVEREMTRSLHSITKEGVYRYASEERQDWISSVLGMISLVGSQIWWTWEVRRKRQTLTWIAPLFFLSSPSKFSSFPLLRAILVPYYVAGDRSGIRQLMTVELSSTLRVAVDAHAAVCLDN